MTAHPGNIDTLDPRWNHRFFTTRVRYSAGREYALSALCGDAEAPSITKNDTEA